LILLVDASNMGFICFTIGCALAPSLNALVVFRFFAGVCGATPMSNGGGSVGDLIRPEKRGAAMAGYLLGSLLGPIIGPIAGGAFLELRYDGICISRVGGLELTLSQDFLPIRRAGLGVSGLSPSFRASLRSG
jgi:MFS family permease